MLLVRIATVIALATIGTPVIESPLPAAAGLTPTEPPAPVATTQRRPDEEDGTRTKPPTGALDAGSRAPRLDQPDELPLTGTNAPLPATLGVLLIAAGGLMMLATRRHKHPVRPIHARTYG
jgi:LPXTG-motif cell wall-anchored protein